MMISDEIHKLFSTYFHKLPIIAYENAYSFNENILTLSFVILIAYVTALT